MTTTTTKTIKLRRFSRTFALLAALLLLVTGCASRGGEAVDIDPAAAAQTILDNVAFKDTLVKAEDGAAEMYYKLDDTITDYTIYISGSGATAEEIAVLKTASADDAKKAESIVNARIEDLKFRFEDYVPAEMVKLGDPVIVRKGNAVILVIADDAAAAKKVVDGLS